MPLASGETRIRVRILTGVLGPLGDGGHHGGIDAPRLALVVRRPTGERSDDQ
jgi:hypothetical protein